MINNNDENITQTQTNMYFENIHEKKLENNDTLLISEIKDKVILPYTLEEINKIIEDASNCYSTKEEVIEKIYTRSLESYKFQFWSRYNETINLLNKKNNYGLVSAVKLALEMLPKRYLHPAIITACKDINELNVYLDCLEKNELDDFKIFNIKYEIYPLVIKEENRITTKKSYINKIIDFFKKFFYSKKEFN